MSRFSSGVASAAGTNNTPIIEIINTSTTKDAYVKSITAGLAAGTATSLGLGRPAAIGITPTTPAALLDEYGSDTGVVKTAIAWGTAPTVPASYLRRGQAAAAIGNQIVFTFAGKGLRLQPGQTLVLWTLTTSSLCNVTAEVEQDVASIANP